MYVYGVYGVYSVYGYEYGSIHLSMPFKRLTPPHKIMYLVP